jgi:hypothetical protein
MALLDIFNGFARGQNGGAPQRQEPVLDPSKQNPTVPGEGTPRSDGTNPAIPKAGEGDKSPLDGFKDLWQKSDKDGVKPNLVPTLTVDPKKLSDASKQVDFTKHVSPDALDKAAKGDAASLGQVINEAAQAAFAQAAGASTKILEAALQAQARSFEEKVMPDILRRNAISNSLRADNPLFDNPAVAPMLTMVEQQFAVKFPTATPAEISEKAKEYLSGFASALVGADGKTIVDPKAVTPGNKPQLAREEQDWSKFFES